MKNKTKCGREGEKFGLSLSYPPGVGWSSQHFVQWGSQGSVRGYILTRPTRSESPPEEDKPISPATQVRLLCAPGEPMISKSPHHRIRSGPWPLHPSGLAWFTLCAALMGVRWGHCSEPALKRCHPTSASLTPPLDTHPTTAREKPLAAV